MRINMILPIISLFSITFLLLVIIIIPIFTTAVFGQKSESVLEQANQTNINQTKLKTDTNNQITIAKNITISSTEFNQLLKNMKASIKLIQEDDNDVAISKLGIAIIQILNSTQQYQELAKFAYSSYLDIIQQQANQFDDEIE